MDLGIVVLDFPYFFFEKEIKVVFVWYAKVFTWRAEEYEQNILKFKFFK